MPNSSRHLVDPELSPLLDRLPLIDLDHASLATARSLSAASLVGLADERLAPSCRHAPGRDGAPTVPLLVFDPPSKLRDRAAILHIHGGGMVIGSADMARIAMPSLALLNDIVVVSVDYRLAPEACFPGPQEDIYSALLWLAVHAGELGVDPTRVVVMGESAGGGLAAALALMTRDRGGPALAGQVLTYPMLDYRTGGADDCWRNRGTGEFIWTRARNQFGWQALRGDYALADDRIGWFSPSLAADLAKLPPCFVGVGALDLFLDENLDYARRLADSGVPVELHVYPGAVHGFDLMRKAQVTLHYRHELTAAIRAMTKDRTKSHGKSSHRSRER